MEAGFFCSINWYAFDACSSPLDIDSSEFHANLRIVRDPKEEFFECKYFLFLFDMNEISARLIASEVP